MQANGSSPIYEFPLTARIRYFLRYEFIVQGLQDRLAAGGVYANIETLKLLGDLVELTRNNDLKSEVLQHLRWQEQQLLKLRHRAQVDQDNLQALITRKQELLDELDSLMLPTAQYYNHHFLSSIKRRLNIPGGICNFDLPAFSAWLYFSEDQRAQDLEQWFQPFRKLHVGIHDCLELTRRSQEFTEHVAKVGYYSQEFEDLGKTFHMIRIQLASSNGIFPEVSAGKPRFTIHFFKLGNLKDRPEQAKEPIQFKLAFCTM